MLALLGSCRGVVGISGDSELRPDQVPIIGAEVAARNSAIGGALDRQAVHWAGSAVGIAVLPLANLGVRFHPGTLAQFANREGPVAG